MIKCHKGDWTQPSNKSMGGLLDFAFAPKEQKLEEEKCIWKYSTFLLFIYSFIITFFLNRLVKESVKAAKEKESVEKESAIQEERVLPNNLDPLQRLTEKKMKKKLWQCPSWNFKINLWWILLNSTCVEKCHSMLLPARQCVSGFKLETCSRQSWHLSSIPWECPFPIFVLVLSWVFLLDKVLRAIFTIYSFSPEFLGNDSPSDMINHLLPNTL